ncbi:phosphoribosylanthranilate isomerase [Robertkochia marina]|uniref:N-(5'-phosphoribosyl)anthranilate isomerase n=2 Tax=Robertkochia marina TaxID=1227945 RepID=A0A4V3UY10_9FLAO|nr:phosphoribosylanthranilate isomerase [Robertkochia marina]TRZ44169.1 phosphoribosylanthranilate isomerase [Robertkochia marina]
MKHPENMKAVASAGPDVMGLIFYGKSPRYFEGMLPELPESLKMAGVFVNAEVETVLEKATKYGLSYLQLHGDETPEYCTALRSALKASGNRAELIKVFSVAGEDDLSGSDKYENCADYFLFDTKGKNRGGNGLQFNWQVLQAYKLQIPFLLSGGIGPEDLKALEGFLLSPEGRNCVGIDVNSGFELEPGLKDDKRLKNFISRIRETENIKN